MCNFTKEDIELFWTRVKSLCKERKVTHIKLCEECKIDLGKFKGQLANCVEPKVSDAVKIANYLDVSVEYLVTGENTTYKANTSKILDLLGQATDEVKKL